MEFVKSNNRIIVFLKESGMSDESLLETIEQANKEVLYNLALHGLNLVINRIGAGKNWSESRLKTEINARLRAFMDGYWLPSKEQIMQAKKEKLLAAGMSEEQIELIMSVLKD